MHFHFIASGSKGNATLVYSQNNLILIDLGISKKDLLEGLGKINKRIYDINYAIFTHSHSDHISGYNFLNKYICYSTKGTIKEVDRSNILTFFKPITLGEFRITPLPTSHDAINSCGFLIEDDEGESCVYMTDTGIIINDCIPYMKGKDYYIIESNYDAVMLENSHRTRILKERISGNFGHLSNEDSAEFIASVISCNTKYIFLAHISQECNTREIAKNTFIETFNDLGIIFPSDHIIALKQREDLTI